MKKLLCLLPLLLLVGCDDSPPTSDQTQSNEQETILMEATKAVGMPAIHNFTDRRFAKDILEMRDKSITTYTYVWSDMLGQYKFFCNSIGFGLPYATQFTSPQKLQVTWINSVPYVNVIPQADPNGLFSPAAAEGTWILCKNPNGNDVKPVYVEPRIIVSPFELEKKSPAAAPTKAAAPVKAPSGPLTAKTLGRVPLSN